MSFYPPDKQDGVDRKSQIVSNLVGPIAGHCVLAFGILWWAWDLYILPYFGYRFDTEENKEYSEEWGAEVLNVRYNVSNFYFRAIPIAFVTLWLKLCRDMWSDPRVLCTIF